MKKQILKDERVLMQKRKILGEAYGILMIVLLVSILIQQFLFNAPFKQYAVEFICFFGISFYILIRNLMLGINIFGDEKSEKKIMLINSIVTGISVTIVNGILNYIQYAEHYEGRIQFFIATLIVTFISATIGTFLFFALFSFINHMKQREIEKKLDEEE